MSRPRPRSASAHTLALLVACALAAAPASPAAAQTTHAVAADQAALDDGGALAGARPTCLDASPDLSAPPSRTRLTFFDAASGALAQHTRGADAGARTAVLATAAELAAVAGGPVTACVDLERAARDFYVPTDTLFVAVEVEGGPDRVLRFVEGASAGGALARVTDPAAADDGDGLRGVAFLGGALYLARAAADGAPATGVYAVNAVAVVDDPGVAPELAPTFVAVCGSGGLFEACALTGIAIGMDLFSDFPEPAVSVLDEADGETRVATFGYSVPDRTGVPAVSFEGAELVRTTAATGVAAGPGALAVQPDRGFWIHVASAGAEPPGDVGVFFGEAALNVAAEPRAERGVALAVRAVPNPARGRVRVAWEGHAEPAAVELRVLDVRGRAVLSQRVRGASAGLDAGALAAGVYAVEVRDTKGRAVGRTRLVVAR